MQVQVNQAYTSVSNTLLHLLISCVPVEQNTEQEWTTREPASCDHRYDNIKGEIGHVLLLMKL